MPTIFSHAVCAVALGRACASRPMPARFWWLAALCAVIPDADVIAFAFGVPYLSMWGHRGITHSIAFAVALGCLVAFTAFRNVEVPMRRASLAAFFTLATLSHPLLDALTSGGRGPALLAPFTAKRYFAPWRPIRVSPIGTDFFSPDGAMALASELLWVWLPSGILAGVAVLWSRRRDEESR